MAGYSGISMSNNAREAHAEGRKPFSCITKDDILKHGVNENISFFKWFVKNYCRSDEWHHTSPKYNQTSFYDIEKCCNAYKEFDIEKLKEKYKKEAKSKTENIQNDNPYYGNAPYYAKIEYSVSTYTGSRKYIEAYGIIYKCWAYMRDDYYNKIIRKNINGGHFHISEKYKRRPDEMPESVVNEILEKYTLPNSLI